MKPTLNTSILIRNLSDMEGQPAQSAKLPACLADMGHGVSYLFTALLSPLMNGYEVYSSQLDMERFTPEDIQELHDLWEDDPNFFFPATEKLRRMYELLIEAQPKCTSVSFL